MSQRDKPRDLGRIPTPSSERSKDENNIMNVPYSAPYSFPNPLENDIERPNFDLNDSNPQNNGMKILYQNNGNLVDLLEENPKDISYNLYVQLEEEEVNYENEIITNGIQQNNINYSEFQKETNNQKNNPLSNFNLSEKLTGEKEIKQGGTDLDNSLTGGLLFSEEMKRSSREGPNILTSIKIEGDTENIDLYKSKDPIKTPNDSEKNSDRIFPYKSCINEGSKNLNEFNFLKKKSATERTKEGDETKKNEIPNINFRKEIKKSSKHLLPLGKSFEEKFGSKTSENISSKLNNSSTGASITLNNSSKNRSNISKDISSEISNSQNANNFSFDDEDSKNAVLNNSMNNLKCIKELSDILNQRKLDQKLKYGNEHSSFISLQDKSSEFGLIINKSLNFNNTFSLNPKYNFPKKSNKKPKKQTVIEMKRDRVRKEIEARMKNPKSNGDLEKRIHREFRKYLKENEKNNNISSVSNNILKEYYKKDIKSMNIVINGKKINSYSFTFSEMVFKKEGVSEIYEEFLEDIKFHDEYIIKIKQYQKNTKFNIDFELYRKNIHKIYCDKYQINDLYFPKFISYKSC